MPRLLADIRISLKKRGGRTVRIELVRQPAGQRFWIRRDGTRSRIVPEASASEIADRIRRWLCLVAHEPLRKPAGNSVRSS